jgi:hypothetical protein
MWSGRWRGSVLAPPAGPVVIVTELCPLGLLIRQADGLRREVCLFR